MNYLLFDLETTGLLRPDIAKLDHQPRIIEIYATLIDEKNRTQDTFHSMINPGIRLPPFISKHTGIRRKDIRNAPSFEHCAKDVVDIMNNANACVAHNAMFDIGVLTHEFKRIGFNIHPPRIICTVEQCEHLFGKRPTMSQLYTYCTEKSPPKGIHRADVDVRMLRDCFVYLHKHGIVK